MKPHRIDDSPSYSVSFTPRTQRTQSAQSSDEDMDVCQPSSSSNPTHVMRDDAARTFQLKPDTQTQERSAPNKIGSGPRSSSQQQRDEDMSSSSMQISPAPVRQKTTGIGAQQSNAPQKKYPQDWNIAPHSKDVGRDFFISLPNRSSPVIAQYCGRDKFDDHIFEYHGKKLVVPEQNIHGYRPTVGRSFPSGMEPRSDDDRLGDRNMVMLSSGDLSEPLARQRKDPQLVERMATTTFEQQPNYASYQSNQEQLSRLGVPILNNMNLSKPSDVQRMQDLPPDAHVHFQMPRVPQGTKGYSTQQLIRDTASIPKTLGKPDLQMSVTTPQPGYYKTPAKHNQIYGMENGSSLKGTDRQVASKRSDDNLEEFGYGHRRTTVDDSTDAAKDRMTYTLQRKPDDDEDNNMVT